MSFNVGLREFSQSMLSSHSIYIEILHRTSLLIGVRRCSLLSLTVVPNANIKAVHSDINARVNSYFFWVWAKFTLGVDFLFKENPNGSYMLPGQIPIGFQFLLSPIYCKWIGWYKKVSCESCFAIWHCYITKFVEQSKNHLLSKLKVLISHVL